MAAESSGRSYKPGSRRKDLPGESKRRDAGLLSESRWAWCRTIQGQFVILVDKNESDEADPEIRFYHPIPGRPPFQLKLTALTREELEAFKDLINSAIDWSMPIVTRRDKEAADAFAAGDDSHSRIYRQVPQLVYRTRPKPEHSEGVQHGHENVPAVGPEAGPDDDVDLDGDSVRGPGDGLAELDESGVEPQDDGPTPDQPPSVFPVVRQPPPLG